MKSRVASTLTFEEFEQLPDPPEGRYELVRGELVLVPPPTLDHTVVQDNLFEWLNARLSADWKRRIEFPCRLGNGTFVIADIGVTTTARWRAASGGSYFQGAPELAIENISPGNTAAEVDDKIGLYFEHGAQECWVVKPARKTVRVERGHEIHRYGASDVIPLKQFGIDEPLPIAALFDAA